MEHVFSGETKAINEVRFSDKWYPDFEEERVDWDKLIENDTVRKFMGSLKFVPLYQYITNYLFYWFYKKQPASEMTEEMLDDLEEKTAAEFIKNKMPDAKCKPAHIREILTTEWSREWDNFENASTERIIELALGLNLPIEDVEELLQKAVKRAGFNYHDPDELLTYCVIRYQKEDRFRCLEALKRDYELLSIVDDPEEIAERRETEEVRDELESIMEGEIYASNVYEMENLNPSLKYFLEKQKADQISARTAAMVFDKLYQEMIGKCSNEILAYKEAYRASEKGSFAETKLKITYDAEQEVVIPMGTVFYAKKKDKKYGTVYIEFQTVREERLPACDYVEVAVPIKGKTKYQVEKNKKQTPGYIKKQEALILKDTEEITGLKEIYTESTVKYSGKPGSMEYADGVLTVKAVPGTEILEGTVFCYGDWEYVSTEDVMAEAVEKIDVESVTAYDAGVTVTDTNTIVYMKKPIEGILDVTNPKPVKMKEITNKISKEVFREYLYGHNLLDLAAGEEKDIAPLLGRWFTETEITSVRFSKIQKQLEAKRKSDMQKNEVRRCDIITMAFLSFCANMTEEDFDGSEECLRAVYNDFLDVVDTALEECRMMPFYLANPYERLLAYLLVTDTPVDSLRNMWVIVNAGRRNMNE